MKPGREFPGVGVGVVLIDDNRLLLLRRDGSHGAGTWSVPGGWVELWEDPLDAAEREMLEETGLTVKATGTAGWTNATHKSEGVHAVTLWVTCEHVSGEPTIMEPEKCSALRWVPFDEVPGLDLFQPLRKWWLAFLELVA